VKITWSYSSIKTFAQCPKKYYHLKVAKDVEDVAGEAASYGTEMHKAAEDHVQLGTPLPPKFAFLQPFMDAVKNIPGQKYCELKLGIKKDGDTYTACEFDSPDYWWHGIADLLIIDGYKAYSMDYKTSKNAKYADSKQLDLIAAAIFLHFPQVMLVKSALAFVVSGEFVKKEHVVTERSLYLNVFENELEQLADAHNADVWNAKTSGLCRFCPVKQCEHNNTLTTFWRK
jgi:CRISPR/Cas system-associated exonuclease Cas4 (RecB family)